MKRKKVKLEFYYTNEKVLKSQLQFIFKHLNQGVQLKEFNRYFGNFKSTMNIEQNYLNVRPFKLVTDKEIIIKSNI